MNYLILKKMKEKRFSQKEMARKLGMSECTFSRKFKNLSWSFADFVKFVKILEFSNSEILFAIKGQFPEKDIVPIQSATEQTIKSLLDCGVLEATADGLQVTR